MYVKLEMVVDKIKRVVFGRNEIFQERVIREKVLVERKVKLK